MITVQDILVRDDASFFESDGEAGVPGAEEPEPEPASSLLLSDAGTTALGVTALKLT